MSTATKHPPCGHSDCAVCRERRRRRGAADPLAARKAFLSAQRTLPPEVPGRKQRKLIELRADIQAGEPAGSEVAYLHSAFCQVGLPRSNPQAERFERFSGHLGLRLQAGQIFGGVQPASAGLPYGIRPRQLMLHVIDRYLRTRNRTVELQDSLHRFMTKTLCIEASGGPRGAATSFKRQLRALATCDLTIDYRSLPGAASRRKSPRGLTVFEPTTPHDSDAPEAESWPRTVTLSREFAVSLRVSAVPLDVRALRGIQDSALSLDIYAWLAHRLHRLEQPAVLHWANLRSQFAHEYDDTKSFKRTFEKSLEDVLMVYPQANVLRTFGGIRLAPSAPPVRASIAQRGVLTE